MRVRDEAWKGLMLMIACAIVSDPASSKEYSYFQGKENNKYIAMGEYIDIIISDVAQNKLNLLDKNSVKKYFSLGDLYLKPRNNDKEYCGPFEYGEIGGDVLISYVDTPVNNKNANGCRLPGKDDRIRISIRIPKDVKCEENFNQFEKFFGREYRNNISQNDNGVSYGTTPDYIILRNEDRIVTLSLPQLIFEHGKRVYSHGCPDSLVLSSSSYEHRK